MLLTLRKSALHQLVIVIIRMCCSCQHVSSELPILPKWIDMGFFWTPTGVQPRTPQALLTLSRIERHLLTQRCLQGG